MRQKLYFESKEDWLKQRLSDITSTESSALLGLSPYDTAFSIYHRKKDARVVVDDISERMKWGTRLQAAIANGVAEDKGWKIRDMNEYMRDPINRIGASFDYYIEDEDAILEVKNVDAIAFKEGWIVDDGEIVEAPPHIEIQVQTQMYVAEKDTAWIAALTGGNSIKMIKRHKDPEIVDRIIFESVQFWKDFDLDKAPEVDFERDAKLIQKLYSKATKDLVMDARHDDILLQLVNSYSSTSKEEKELSQKKQILKAQILSYIKDHEKVFSDEFTISAGMVKEAEVSFKRDSYRNFKVTMKKGEK